MDCVGVSAAGVAVAKAGGYFRVEAEMSGL